jgi:hydroxymethylbilane synthase
MDPLRIGTRESELAIWQAQQVRDLLERNGFATQLIPIKSEGDIDLQTPLYEMGVQGIFTRSLDIALLNDKIDLAVHSMKDVPTHLPDGIQQAAVLKRGNPLDLLVYKDEWNDDPVRDSFIIATSSIRRKAQWLNRYPQDEIVNLRGNVNTRLEKLHNNNWKGAVFAAAGLERINKRPEHSIELNWMLPAPAQGAIMVVCRSADQKTADACSLLNDKDTAVCTAVERDFLRALMGGCSVPISAYVQLVNDRVLFRGNMLTTDGRKKAEIEKTISLDDIHNAGSILAEELLNNGGREIADQWRNEKGN